MYAGGLNVVMGKIFHHTPSTIVRITLVSLAVAAERVRFLAEREEIEVDDLPPPTIPPTLTKVKAGVSGYTNGYVMRRMRLAQLLENVRKTLRLRGSDGFRLDSPQLHQVVRTCWRGSPTSWCLPRQWRSQCEEENLTARRAEHSAGR
jgi:hypothetical protein